MEKWEWEGSTVVEKHEYNIHVSVKTCTYSIMIEVPICQFKFLHFMANMHFIHTMSHFTLFSAVQSANFLVGIQTPTLPLTPNLIHTEGS
jgi:hypothetical protein